jgi:orotidine-5'-phosphate decarboxylase
MKDPLERVAVALDTPDRNEFRRWCAFFGPRVGVLKVGLEAFVRWGPDAVAEARGAGRAVFLDLKLHDIPNTVAGAVGAAAALGVDYLTVHAGGGEAMLRTAVEAAKSGPRILAVTVLTSLDDDALRGLDMPGNAAERAARWTSLARAAGCSGVVCSPQEAADLRRIAPPPFLLVTPGIRTSGGDAGDQRRTATAVEAVEAGADVLVIGRPLTRAENPELALAELAAGLARTA